MWGSIGFKHTYSKSVFKISIFFALATIFNNLKCDCFLKKKPDLSKNRFNELPDEVIGFSFLERLQCHHNAIRYIPETVGGLQNLSYVDLSRNQLTVLPREICQLPIQVQHHLLTPSVIPYLSTYFMKASSN